MSEEEIRPLPDWQSFNPEGYEVLDRYRKMIEEACGVADFYSKALEVNEGKQV